jgi:surface carbohydrate biosynthesis protein
MRVALVVDSPKRDLDGIVLIAYHLARRGAEALVVPMYQQGYDLPLLRPHGVIVNYARTNNAELLASYRALGSSVMVLDTEGGVLSESGVDAPRNWARSFRAAGYERLVNGYFFWGPRLLAAFGAESGLPQAALRLTGCPRYDFCAEPWRRLLAAPDAGYVLVNTNFSAINPRFTASGDAEKRIFLELGWAPDYVARLFTDLQAVWPRYLDAIAELARRVPGRRILVRPHPFEDEARYAQRFAGVPNVRVDGSGNVLPLIANAACVVHLNCGTAVESTMLGTPAISLEFLNTDTMRAHAALPSQLSIAASSIDELERIVRGAQPGASARREHLEPWFHRIDGEAASRVADAALEISSDAREPRRSIAASLRGARAVSAPRVLAGAASALLGSRRAGRVQGLLKPARRAKAFSAQDVESCVQSLAKVEGANSRFTVAHARHPLTGMRLGSIRVRPA